MSSMSCRFAQSTSHHAGDSDWEMAALGFDFGFEFGFGFGPAACVAAVAFSAPALAPIDVCAVVDVFAPSMAMRPAFHCARYSSMTSRRWYME